jgi:hypothetical protein
MTGLSSHLQSIVTANSAIYQASLTENSIRIVQLHSGHVDEPISCSFSMVDLGKAESFQALSYCWGSEPADKPIFCNGQPFSPTKNLYAALKQLRLVSRVRYMWIDAVWWLHAYESRQRLIFSLIRYVLTRTALPKETNRCR